VLVEANSRQVNWDATKDEQLWSILSGVSKTEIDCKFCEYLMISRI